MTEFKMSLLIVLSVTCWMLGGSGVWPFRKNWRRIVWPIIVFVILLTSQVAWWQALFTAVATFLVTTLPYGERTPWWGRGLVFASYATPAWCISLQNAHVGVLFCGILLFLWFAMSRAMNQLSHKTWEGLAGFLQAVSIIIATLSR